MDTFLSDLKSSRLTFLTIFQKKIFIFLVTYMHIGITDNIVYFSLILSIIYFCFLPKLEGKKNFIYTISFEKNSDI